MSVEPAAKKRFSWLEREWPSPQSLQGALAKSGFRFGQEMGRSEEIVRTLPHTVKTADFSTLPRQLDTTKRCAMELMGLLKMNENTIDLSQLVQLSGTTFIGQQQKQLLDLLEIVNYHPSIRAGYQSPAFLALLFAARYLNGSLLDATGRYTVAPPGYSDHHVLDGALDVDDSILFPLHVLKIRSQLKMSLAQPYLFHPILTHEPGHWRCIIGESERYADIPLLPESLQSGHPEHDIDQLIQFFARQDGQLAQQRDHLFVTGLSHSGASVCVGSLQETFTASLQDALQAVGQGWDGYYITIPEGYTPIFDNKVLPQDIGRCMFKAVEMQSGRTVYLTGQSCCNEKVNTPSRVIQALEAKGHFPNSEVYRISKSRILDMAYLPSRSLLPCAYGLPLSLSERDADAASLIIEGYTTWLLHGLQGGLPLYASHDYARTFSTYRDHTRYAFMLFLLAKYRAWLHPGSQALIERLFAIYCEGDSWHTLLQGNALEEDHTPEATVVFLIHALQTLGLQHSARDLWSSSAKRVQEEVRAICQNGGNENGLLFLGHLCDLFASAPPSEQAELTSFGLSSAIIQHFCQSASPHLVYSCALSQLLKYAAVANMDIDTATLAARLTERFISHPGSPVPAERGAFAHYESFLSALPLEALLNLRSLMKPENADDEVLLSRVQEGLVFLRKLQFQHGSGLMTPHPHLLEGALRFSLVDHHFRMDYGLHALNVAVQVCMLAGGR